MPENKTKARCCQNLPFQQQGIAVSEQVGTHRAVQRAEENSSYYFGKLLLTLRQDSQGKVTAGVRQMIQLEKTEELLDTQILLS